MKKLLGILFLSLLLSGNSYAKKFVKLPKDVGSGSKFYKSLTGKDYKKHGFQIVNKNYHYENSKLTLLEAWSNGCPN